MSIDILLLRKSLVLCQSTESIFNACVHMPQRPCLCVSVGGGVTLQGQNREFRGRSLGLYKSD